MNPLNSVAGTIIGGIVLAVVLVLVTMGDHTVGAMPVNSIIILLHVLSGITWIGLLYYFNFVQVPALADAAADDGGPGGAGITKYVAPRALWWFRWTALLTWLTGAAFLLHRGQLDDAFALGMAGDVPNAYATTIGIGDDHRNRCLARNVHAVQRLGLNLAESEKDTRYRRGQRR
jgi:uncharacterized membrane protein